MNRVLHHAAFAVGLAALAWTGAGAAASNPVALVITLLIGAFYLMGALELHRFHQATTGLSRALAALPEALPALAPWLGAHVPAPLQNTVRLRIEGERVALPGPALTPYLAGLLVLLGMLGTFVGMVVTLNGTGLALEHATDLAAVRATLSAPVKGLGLAFGTSVAGVATSAMLGLMSALCRRERLQTGQRLEAAIATRLRVFSRAHQRDESLRLLQRQTELMPALVDRLQDMMGALARQGETLNERLGTEQARFHADTTTAYGALASSVERALTTSLAEGAQQAAANIQPIVEATMAGIAREAAALHGTLAQTVQQQLEGLSARFEAGTAALVDQVTTQLNAAHTRLETTSAARDEQRLAAWSATVATMAASLQQAWQQAGDATLAQQQALCATLADTAQAITTHTDRQARQTIAEIERLVQAAAEAPRAAAEVIAELRQRLSDSLARDNTLLDERQHLLGTLGTLLDAVNHASHEQRSAIDTLVATSTDLLHRVGSRFGEQAEAHAQQMNAVVGQVSASAIEVASLGEAFSGAVALFGQSNDTLVAQLQRIEAALGRSLTRSDEQLAYYVAQAREVIDLSLTSQKQIVDDLQRLARTAA